MLKSFILPVSLMVGTIIGAGIFSLPFIFSQSGLLTGIFYLVILTAVSIIIHLMYADIIINDYSSLHRFPGYAQMHLGKSAGALANIIIFAQLILIMTIYLILSASFVNLVFPALPALLKILIFWGLGSIPLFLNAKKEAEFEFFTSGVTVLVILIMFFIGLNGFSPGKNLLSPNWSLVFLPFGPVLFSLLGEAAIAPVVVYFKNNVPDFSKIRQVILWGSIIPALFYLAFVIGILGITPDASPDAVSGLIGQVPLALLILLGVFGFVSLWDSYVTIGSDLRKILEYDWKLPKLIVGLIVVPLPFFLYLLGIQNFIQLVSVVGGVLFSIWAVFIILIWRKLPAKENDGSLLKKIPSFLIWLLFIVFIAAIAYELINFL